uniref:T-complex protein 1 subunit gamma n=1 Tax=Cercocebus atys TaxID=9531 RepID=A0A2K5LK22_CERAT
MEGPLSVFGDRSTGEAIRSQNVMTAASIANIVKSSLGPVGLDKMLVDDIGDNIPAHGYGKNQYHENCHTAQDNL